MSMRDDCAFSIHFEGLRHTSQMSVNDYDIQFTSLPHHVSYKMNYCMWAKRFIRGMIDPLLKPIAPYLTSGYIKYSQAVDLARELETRWSNERTIKAQNK